MGRKELRKKIHTLEDRIHEHGTKILVEPVTGCSERPFIPMSSGARRFMADAR